MDGNPVKRTSDEDEQQKAFVLYKKVLHAVKRGKDATIKRRKNGELAVYEVDMKIAE